MKRKRSEEEQHQVALIKWASMHKRIFKRLWHTPNGGSRNIIEAVKLKEMGTKAGVWDLFLAIPTEKHPGLFIEMKSKKGVLSKSQKEFRDDLSEDNYCFRIARTWIEARDHILEYLGKKCEQPQLSKMAS